MGKQILIADDAAFMRVMLKDILEKSGYEIIGEASNGKEALDMYKELRPDLVTMDITMPEMDGIKAVELIREYDTAATVVMCSAMGQQGMIMKAMKAGAKDFIVKPFDDKKVLNVIQKLID